MILNPANLDAIGSHTPGRHIHSPARRIEEIIMNTIDADDEIQTASGSRMPTDDFPVAQIMVAIRYAQRARWHPLARPWRHSSMTWGACRRCCTRGWI